MIENIAVNGCHSIVCILLIYSWGAFKQGSLAPLSYHIRFKHSYEVYKGIQMHGHILVIFPCTGCVYGPSLIAPKEVQCKVHSECTLRVHYKRILQSEKIYRTKLNNPYFFFHKLLASYSHVLVQFNIKTLSENSLQRSILYKNPSQGGTEGALSDSLRTR